MDLTFLFYHSAEGLVKGKLLIRFYFLNDTVMANDILGNAIDFGSGGNGATAIRLVPVICSSTSSFADFKRQSAAAYNRSQPYGRSSVPAAAKVDSIA